MINLNYINGNVLLPLIQTFKEEVSTKMKNQKQ